MNSLSHPLRPRRLPRLLLIAIAALALSACNTPQNYRVHETVLETVNPPSNDTIVVLPIDIEVKELGLGGATTELIEESEKARSAVLNAIKIHANGNERLDFPIADGLSDADKERLEQYAALIRIASTQSGAFHLFPAWKHKVKHYDYSVGDGLAEYAERLGHDKALVIFGRDYRSSGGRIAAGVLAAMLGVAAPPAPTFVNISVIDLKTGDILWTTFKYAPGQDSLTNEAALAETLDDLFKNYPVSKEYRQWVEKL